MGSARSCAWRGRDPRQPGGVDVGTRQAGVLTAVCCSHGAKWTCEGEGSAPGTQKQPGDSHGVRELSAGAGKILPPQRFLSPNRSLRWVSPFPVSAPLTVSPCPGDAGSLWMLPWKGPQEKPSGRLRRARTRCSPSRTASSSSSAERNTTSAGPWHRGPPRPHPHPNPFPKGCLGGVKNRKVSFRLVLGENRSRAGAPNRPKPQPQSRESPEGTTRSLHARAGGPGSVPRRSGRSASHPRTQSRSSFRA